MAYNLEDVRENVRFMIPGNSASSYSEAHVDLNIMHAKRRLDDDKPRELTGELAGDDGRWFSLSALTGWVNDWSQVLSLQYPAPDIAADDELNFVGRGYWRAPILKAGVEYLHTLEPISFATGSSALVKYTARWAIGGLDGALETTLSERWRSALEFLAAAMMCRALSARSAGVFDQMLEGDVVDWRSRQAEFRSVADQYMSDYYREVGIDPDRQPPAAINAGIPSVNSYDEQWITHRTRPPGGRFR